MLKSTYILYITCELSSLVVLREVSFFFEEHLVFTFVSYSCLTDNLDCIHCIHRVLIIPMHLDVEKSLTCWCE